MAEALHFEQWNPGPCRTYLVASPASRDAILVDPVLEELDAYLERLERQRWTLRYVVDTHTHADHVSAAAALAERTGAEYAMHKRAGCRRVTTRLTDGAAIAAGPVRLVAIETPGHTKDSVSLLLDGGRLLTGDWLFIGGAGRTDLPGGDPAEHWESLRRVVPGLDEATRIYPGHDYANRSTSTLAEELRSNPNLRPRSREEYVAWLAALARPTPDWMIETIRANLAGTTDPSVRLVPEGADAACMACEPPSDATAAGDIAPEELWAELERGMRPLLLDVRQPEEFTGPLGHVPGARLVPLGELAARLDELGDERNGPVVTICKTGGRSAHAAALLRRAGFADVRNLLGGTEAWRRAGLPVEH